MYRWIFKLPSIKKIWEKLLKIWIGGGNKHSVDS